MNTSGTTTRRDATAWPIWLFIAIVLVVNAGLSWLVNRASDVALPWVAWSVTPVAEGLLWGEVCFVLLIAGFGGRKWLDGFLIGLALSCAGAGALFAGAWFDSQWYPELLLELSCEGPVYLLAAVIPAYAFRHFFGWGLVRAERPADRLPLSIQDLLGGVAVAAAGISLLRAPLVISEQESGWYWRSVAPEVALVAGLGLVFIPSMAWLGLATRSRLAFAIGSLLLVPAAYVTTVAATLFQHDPDPMWTMLAEVLLWCLPLTATAAIVFLLSVISLRLSGVSLRTHLAVAQQQHNAHQRRRTKLQIVAVLGVAVVVSAYLGYLESWRAEQDRENARLGELAAARGGEVFVRDRQIYGLSFGPGSRDGDLDLMKNCADVWQLYLDGSGITDAGLSAAVNFPQLRDVSLVDTLLTDVGLVHLRHSRLAALDISGTKMTGRGLVHVAPGLTHLVANRSAFDDEGCSQLPRLSELWILCLQDTKITDEGTKHFAELSALSQLELQRTNITGSGLAGLPSLSALSLQGSSVDDVGIASIVDSQRLADLSLGGTRITDGAMDAIAQLRALKNLNMDDTAITDEGLKKLSAAHLHWLDLSGTRVTGAGFAAWSPQSEMQVLKLDRTAVTDEQIDDIRTLSWLFHLSLADTQITDASLSKLHIFLSRFEQHECDRDGTVAGWLGRCQAADTGLGTIHRY